MLSSPKLHVELASTVKQLQEPVEGKERFPGLFGTHQCECCRVKKALLLGAPVAIDVVSQT